MIRTIDSGRLRWISIVALGWMIGDWPSAMGQEGSPSVPQADALPRAAVSPSDAQQELLDRLLKMEERLDQVTRQNEQLAREPDARREVQDLSRRIGGAGPRATVTGVPDGAASSGTTGAISDSTMSSGLGRAPGTSGGGSASGGGDPTNIGRAEEIGNRHRGKLPLKVGYYDFDNDGIRWGTDENEFTLGIRAMQQIDARIYANPNQEFASGGIFNPRTRVYFEGNLTRPINYEFSFQETYNTTNLLDSYVNYRFSDGFQLRFGRYKTPFTYEWYRVHVWHLLAPERSLFATNFEGNRRFGFMGWGSPSATGWNMRSGPLTVSGTRTWSSTAARTS